MFYLINKPSGISSFKAIKQFAQKKKIAKIGHSGTLDPLASGALLVATNDDTKLLDYVLDKTKTYVVTFQVGYTSNTFDKTGKVKKESDANVSLETLKKALLNFKGKGKQIPPQFSAKKVSGKRSYQLARKGIEVSLEKIPIEIHKITNIKKESKNIFSFKVKVSAGTYIRAIINDLGLKLETGAIMTKLKRVEIGKLKLESDVKVIDPLNIIKLPTIKLKTINELLEGKKIAMQKKAGLYLLLFKEKIVGIGNIENHILSSKKLFGNRIHKILMSPN